MFELTNLDSIQIGMASSEQILAWSYGEVCKPETINYRTLKPERDGLYCERIFGPQKDWECACGKYKRIKFKDKEKVCDKCGVQITRAKVRRERMGHIQLAAPVSHIWYFKGIPSRMGMLLDVSPRALEKVLYFASYIVLNPGNEAATKVSRNELITDSKYRAIMALPAEERGEFKAGIGAEAVKEMLLALDLEALSVSLKKEIADLIEKERDRDGEGQKRTHAIKRLEVVEAFRMSNNKPEVWDILEGVIKEHPVLLNRAPTLHRLGIQAFEPVLVEGKAIKLHPLACTAYNADFDGDQMAVHVPLSVEAQAEARYLMLCANNIMKPQDGTPVISPTQDMVIGCHYLTITRDDAKGAGRVFSSPDEAIMAYQCQQISLQAPIKVRIERTFEGVTERRVIDTTLGLLIFNNVVPQDLGFKPRTCMDEMFVLEIDHKVVKKDLGVIVERCFRAHGENQTAAVLDAIKNLGYKYSTRGAITVSVSDIIVPKEKEQWLKETDDLVAKINRKYHRGEMSEDERYRMVTTAWNDTTARLKNRVMEVLPPYNPINMMTGSGARGSAGQVAQLAGMRGLMASPTGRAIEVPIRANFREGLNVLEFFMSSHGSRKSLADTALRTADSGYLTRRLVDVAQEVIVRETDCFESRGEKVRGITVQPIGEIELIDDRIRGRYAAEDVYHPITGELLVHVNEMIDYDKALMVRKAGVTKMQVRSVLTCHSENGVCARCYGMNLAHGGNVDIGEAVGIIAAQAIGEPGTQLTMRNFHSGGVASAEDITQGLPRVEELFEARKPKHDATLAEIAGRVSIVESKKKREIIITNEEDANEKKAYLIHYGARLKVQEGQHVSAGDELIEGSINPHDLLRILGVKAVQEYLLKEVLSVYYSQGVKIADKHIEVIVRQMLRKVRIEDAGDTELLPGGLVDIFQFEQANEKTIAAGGRPAIAKRVLLGITKASLATESFLSAASFQETTRVLTEAAIKGKVDPLLGLKENVIIGKLIPAGTGLKRYKNIELQETY